jgi:IclR family acetate operon transcriptional repressor
MAQYDCTILPMERLGAINSLGRGLRTLQIMAEAEGSVGVSELAQALGVDPSSSYRLLATLEQHGFVRQEPHGKKYALGYAVLDLAGAVLRRLDVASLAGPRLRTLSLETGESAHLAVRDGMRAVFVCRELAAAALRVETAIGSSEPAHCTAVGKVLLAAQPEADLTVLLAEAPLARYTDQTITSVEDLRADLARTLARGYAYDDEELHLGVRCLAAPVRDYQGSVVAAAGISGPSGRLTRDRLPDLAAAVIATAAEITGALGYQAREHG